MPVYLNLIIVLIFSFIDTILNTIIYCHGYKFHETFSFAISTYTFDGSTFDIWSLAVVRTSVLTGLVIGTLVGKERSSQRIKSTFWFGILLVTVQWIFVLVKLLALAETKAVFKDGWFWGLLVWNMVASVGLVLQWRCLGGLRWRTEGAHVLLVNEDHDGIHAGDKSTDKGGKDTAAQGVSVLWMFLVWLLMLWESSGKQASPE